MGIGMERGKETYDQISLGNNEQAKSKGENKNHLSLTTRAEESHYQSENTPLASSSYRDVEGRRWEGNRTIFKPLPHFLG